VQQLYVVGFDVSTVPSSESDRVESPRDVFQQVLAHMAVHAGKAATDLLRDRGETTVPGRAPNRPDSLISWQPVLVNEAARSLRMDIEQELPAGGWFTCQLTVSQIGGDTGFRVVMGRRSEGQLAPARVEEIKPPRSLTAIVQDSTLSCTEGPHHITAAPDLVLTAQVPSVESGIADPHRQLPMLIVSSLRTVGPATAFARKAARRLVGLAQVVLVSGWLACDAFNDGRDELLLPRGGARLYWPGSVPRSPWWDAAALNGDHEALLRQLTRLLAPLSVVARGRDRLWEGVRQAQSVAEMDALFEEIAGEEQASSGRQIDALRSRLQEEREGQLELLKLNEALEAKAARLEIDNANLAAQLDALSALPSAEPDAAPRPPATAPGDFSTAWSEWTEASEGALIFTDRAKGSWLKSSYPSPERMREALSTLADLAGEWRRCRGNLGKSMVSWIGDQTPLAYAPSDEALRRFGLHEFSFEGTSWSREPHIKLDDATSPDRVGRIYFAIDSAGLRWIVDHVGVKLYSLTR
jgi:hypothetical protein